jgi:N6-L-threonylcarbamoyladenine synthase
MLLAIETSCDETAIAVLDIVKFNEPDTGGADDFLLSDLISSQIDLHQPYGGVVPELASREHLKNLPVLIREALKAAKIDFADLTAIAATRGPGLKGCLLVGFNYAKALSYNLKIPLVPVNHLEGHLSAGLLLPQEDRPSYPRLSLLVSGGHSQLLFSKNAKTTELVTTTRDDAAGEAFDKIATLIGLPYPGGPALSRLAEGGNPNKFKLPIGMAKDPNWFSFSGFKTAVQRVVHENSELVDDLQFRKDLAASVEHGIVQSLLLKTKLAILSKGPKFLLLTGGVAANKRLRMELTALCAEHSIRCVIVPPKWCTDNASMIAVCAAEQIHAHEGKLAGFLEANAYGSSAWEESLALSPAARLPVGKIEDSC